MKRKQKPTALKMFRIGSPDAYVSRSLSGALSAEEIRLGIRIHWELDSLPSGFRSRKGRNVLAVSAANRSKVFLIPAGEFEQLSQHVALRELHETTVAE